MRQQANPPDLLASATCSFSICPNFLVLSAYTCRALACWFSERTRITELEVRSPQSALTSRSGPELIGEARRRQQCDPSALVREQRHVSAAAAAWSGGGGDSARRRQQHGPAAEAAAPGGGRGVARELQQMGPAAATPGTSCCSWAKLMLQSGSSMAREQQLCPSGTSSMARMRRRHQHGPGAAAAWSRSSYCRATPGPSCCS